ncbi:tetratricopeptide repeat protein [Gemmata sp. G18]|uniref:Tetratricopeptide repeat protein n=1 Tax=Gemmata palustris TaxID=2822762 RepID=A0ABS5BZ83_9BACT|nr:tetratricopeptide repeat protein [Gemmata palustris]MBP3959042.1 tetratricopeptide repeat protein [Gemmata palustris]
MRRFPLVLVLLGLAPVPARAGAADEWVGQTVFPIKDRLPLCDASGKAIGEFSYSGTVARELGEWLEIRHVIHPGPYVGRVKKAEVVRAAGAEKFFSEKIKADSKNTWAYRNRATVRVLNKDHDGAIDDLTAAIDLDPHFSLYVERGRARRAKGDPDGAVKDYDEALRLEPGYSVALNNRGVLWEAKGRLDAAIEDYTAAIKSDPKYSTPWRNRGLVYQRKGDYEQAARDFAEAGRLDPTSTLLMDDLAWLLATCPDGTVRNGKRALELAKRACELTGFNEPLLLETLAAACAETGDFAKATEYQKKVLTDKEYEKRFGAGTREKLKLYESEKAFRTIPPKGVAIKPPAPETPTSKPRSEQK